jgi:hypothetical protein
VVLKRRDDLGHESTFRLYANAVVNLMRVHELIMNFTVVVVPKLSSRSLIAQCEGKVDLLNIECNLFPVLQLVLDSLMFSKLFLICWWFSDLETLFFALALFEASICMRNLEPNPVTMLAVGSM